MVVIVAINVILKYLYFGVAEFGVYVLAWICIPMAVFTEVAFINSIFYSYLRLAIFTILGKFLMFMIAIPLYNLTKKIVDADQTIFGTAGTIGITVEEFVYLFILLAFVHVGFGAVSDIAGQITGGSIGSSGGGAARPAGRAATAGIKKIISSSIKPVPIK